MRVYKYGTEVSRIIQISIDGAEQALAVAMEEAGGLHLVQHCDVTAF